MTAKTPKGPESVARTQVERPKLGEKCRFASLYRTFGPEHDCIRDRGFFFGWSWLTATSLWPDSQAARRDRNPATRNYGPDLQGPTKRPYPGHARECGAAKPSANFSHRLFW